MIRSDFLWSIVGIVGLDVVARLNQLPDVLSTCSQYPYRTAARAPTSTDDAAAGYVRGSMWCDTVGKRAFVCVAAAAGAARWVAVRP